MLLHIHYINQFFSQTTPDIPELQNHKKNAPVSGQEGSDNY
jgi:hypothetical protein